MSTRLDPDLVIASWLRDEAPDGASNRLLEATRRQIASTNQRRPWWPARRIQRMNTAPKLALAAAAVVAVAVAGINFLPGTGGPGGPGGGPPSPTASPSPTPSPAAFHNGPLAAGTYVMAPFTGANEITVCFGQPGCSEDPADESIRLTLTVPDGYEGAGNRALIWGPDGDTGLIILRGGGLHSDPCRATAPPDIDVGPTVDDFANALSNSPVLDATAAVPVTLAGFSGKYVDLQLPGGDFASCTDGAYWPYEPGVYAQGAFHQWHLWILDVDGVRVVIQSMDYQTTSPKDRDELRAVVDSIRIEP